MNLQAEQDLQSRIEKIERQNRLLFIITVALAIIATSAISGFLLVGCDNPVSSTQDINEFIETKKINVDEIIVGDTGNDHIKINSDFISFISDNGKEVIKISTNYDKEYDFRTSSIRLSTEKESATVGLSTSDGKDQDSSSNITSVAGNISTSLSSFNRGDEKYGRLLIIELPDDMSDYNNFNEFVWIEGNLDDGGGIWLKDKDGENPLYYGR